MDSHFCVAALEEAIETYGRPEINTAHAKRSLSTYFAFYIERRRHQSLDQQTPDGVYYQAAVSMAT